MSTPTLTQQTVEGTATVTDTGEVVAALKQVDLFEGLPAYKMEEFARHAHELRVPAGTLVLEQGDEVTTFNLLVEGKIEWSHLTATGERVITNFHTPVTYGGAMLLLSGEKIPGRAKAVYDARYFVFPRDAFMELVRNCESVLQRVLALYVPNISRIEQAVAQREKLASLGSLAAGLAHEINNPAAAAARSASSLAAAAVTVRRGIAGLDREALDALDAHVASLDGAVAPTGLELSDREDELGDVLERHDVPDPWTLAGEFAEAGVDAGWLSRLASIVGDERMVEAVPWAAAALEVQSLARSTVDALGRVSDLVGAIKTYSYMDQAPHQNVDIHEGLIATMIMLKHKMRDAGTSLHKDFDRSLPRIPAYGAELNQVWTNLLDNAISAARQGGGNVWVSTKPFGPDRVLVMIRDDGPGIPEDVATRIFEPFFTTKDVGEGTGLGLDLVQRIVRQRHGGDIEVKSTPGDTRFLVILPV